MLGDIDERPDAARRQRVYESIRRYQEGERTNRQNDDGEDDDSGEEIYQMTADTGERGRRGSLARRRGGDMESSGNSEVDEPGDRIGVPSGEERGLGQDGGDDDDDEGSAENGENNENAENEDDEDDDGSEDEDSSDATSSETLDPAQDLGLKRIQCNLKLEVRDGEVRDSGMFTDQTFSRPANTTLEHFSQLLRQKIIGMLAKGKNLFGESVKQGKLIAYKVDIQKSICTERTYKPATTKHAVQVLADFFLDPSSEDMTLDVRVVIRWIARPESHENQPEHAYEKAAKYKRKLKPADLVHESHSLSDNADRWTYKYVHLGIVHPDSVEPPDEGHRTASNDDGALSDGQDAWLKLKGVSCPTVLIGYYFKKCEIKPANLKFLKVEAWDFGDYSIGDCIDRYKDHEFDTEDEFLAPFEDVTSKEELHKRIQRYLKSRNPKRSIPFMPTYTCNTYQSKDYGLGSKGSPADIVVRYQLDFPWEGAKPERWLPFNVQYRVHRKTAEEVKDLLITELRDHETDPENKRELRKLFDEPLIDKWTLEFWVLPQGLKKLFKWPTSVGNEQKSLSQFLSHRRIAEAKAQTYENERVQQKAQELSRALYVEAHIVRIGGWADEEAEAESVDEAVDEAVDDPEAAAAPKVSKKQSAGKSGGKTGKRKGRRRA